MVHRLSSTLSSDIISEASGPIGPNFLSVAFFGWGIESQSGYFYLNWLFSLVVMAT